MLSMFPTLLPHPSYFQLSRNIAEAIFVPSWIFDERRNQEVMVMFACEIETIGSMGGRPTVCCPKSVYFNNPTKVFCISP